MRDWKHIDSEGIGVGITEEGWMLWEIEIDGYNDDKDFTDLETVATVTGIYKNLSEFVHQDLENEIHIVTEYHFKDAERNLTVRTEVEKAKEEIKKTMLFDIENGYA